MGFDLLSQSLCVSLSVLVCPPLSRCFSVCLSVCLSVYLCLSESVCLSVVASLSTSLPPSSSLFFSDFKMLIYAD